MASVQSILIVTSTPGFGEMIQQSLEETGSYKTVLVASAMEAISCVQTMLFSLAILDSDLDDKNMPAVCQAMKRIQENLCLVVIPPDNDPQHPDLTQILFDGYLTKPFYLPDLLDTVAEVLCKKIEQTPTLPVAGLKLSSVQSAKTSEPPLEWLRDVTRAAQHLTRLSLESSAQAALIIRQGELWAYAGQLSQPAVQEVTGAVVRFWMDNRPPAGAKSSRSVDMVRVVRLSTTGSDYMLYVTSLGSEMVLALAFDAETPFGTIRAQANFLARSLSPPIESKPQIKTSPLTAQPAIRLPQAPFSPSHAALGNDTFDEDMDELEGDLPPVNLMPLLDNVPPPNPKGLHSQRIDDQRRTPLQSKPTGSAQPPQAGLSAGVSIESSPAIQLGQLHQPDAEPQVSQLFPEVDERPDDEELEIVEKEFRPLTPALHCLYYVCLMIPRLPKHHLTGDLAGALSEMIGQLCLAYGWRLEHIAIRPDYLQLITSVPPTTSPSYLMRVLRQQTSERIFDAFPALRKDNPSGDFWAPGYLIMSGSQLPPAHIVKEFILQTRQQQGASIQARPKV